MPRLTIRFNPEEPGALLRIIAKLSRVKYSTIEVSPGEVAAQVGGDPPQDVELTDILGDIDIRTVPASSRMGVLDAVWKIAYSSGDLKPSVCLVGSAATAKWLGTDPVSRTVHGIPVRLPALESFQESEFMFLLTKQWYDPLHAVEGIVHGHVGEG